MVDTYNAPPASGPSAFGFLSMLTDPIILVSFGLVLVVALVVIFWPKGKKVIILERVKPGWSELRFAMPKWKKNPGELTLNLSDGRSYIVPEEVADKHETVNIPKTMRIKKGYVKLFGLEKGQLVTLGDSLSDLPSGLITPGMIPTILNRGSLRRLATAKGLAGGGWTMLILAVAAGLAFGYIMYPQFNHPSTVIQYCRLINGSYSCGFAP